MKRLFWVFLLLSTLWIVDGYGQLVAEQITKDNAAQRLFSGSDAIPIYIDRNGNGKFDAPGLDKNLVSTSKTLIKEESQGFDPHNHTKFPLITCW